MKGQAGNIIKDFFASILIVVSIVIAILIIFYDDIAIGKVIPQADSYALNDEMKKELEESKLNDVEEVIINYYIDKYDLTKYEKTNEYIKGKDNPFAEVDIFSGGNTTTDNNSSSNSNNSSSGFFDDEGSK